MELILNNKARKFFIKIFQYLKDAAQRESSEMKKEILEKEKELRTLRIDN